MFGTIYNDADLIAAYKKYGSTTKAAQHIGASHETIRRACKRNGIALDGRKNNIPVINKRERKITDAEIIEECKTMTRAEIAEKHNMCICNVDRRLKKLGLKCAAGVGKGSGHSHYKERCKSANCEYDRKIDLRYVLKKYDGICQICGKPVDVNDKNGNRIGKNYPTLDHIVPLSLGGNHTDENVQLAHMVCNSKKGARSI